MDHQAVAQLLGNYGEFVGAIAVVATLGYLTYQIRQNSRSLRANAYQEATRMANDWSQLFVNNRKTLDLLRRGARDYSDLDPADQIEFSHLVSILFRNYSVARSLTQDGFISETIAGIYRNNLSSMFSQPGMRDWWDAQPKIGNAEFENHIDSLVIDASSPQSSGDV